MRKKLSRIISVVLTVVILIAFELPAYALNKDYLEIDKWKNNPNVTYTDIHKTSKGNELNGIFGYYIDNYSMCIYTYFFFTESTVDSDNHFVSVVYNVDSPGESYSFAIDKDGMTPESPAQEKELFSAASAFYPDETCIITAAEYLGKAASLDTTVSLYVNGSLYKNIYAPLHIEKPTTAKPTTTQKTKKTNDKKKANSGNNTKNKKKKSSGNQNTGKSNTSKSVKPNDTTKFVPKGKVNTTEKSKKNKFIPQIISKKTKKKAKSKKSKKTDKNEEIYNEGEEFEISGGESNPLGAATQMSKPSLLLLLLAIILATAGITLLITAAVMKKNKKQDESPAEEEEE